jgi:hypothetical protein
MVRHNCGITGEQIDNIKFEVICDKIPRVQIMRTEVELKLISFKLDDVFKIQYEKVNDDLYINKVFSIDHEDYPPQKGITRIKYRRVLVVKR